MIFCWNVTHPGSRPLTQASPILTPHCGKTKHNGRLCFTIVWKTKKLALKQLIIALYYLLCIGKYTSKGSQNKLKQTVQFKFEDITFFKTYLTRALCCLPCNASDALIALADGATKVNTKKTDGREYVFTRKPIGICLLARSGLWDDNTSTCRLMHVNTKSLSPSGGMR